MRTAPEPGSRVVRDLAAGHARTPTRLRLAAEIVQALDEQTVVVIGKDAASVVVRGSRRSSTASDVSATS